MGLFLPNLVNLQQFHFLIESCTEIKYNIMVFV